MLVPVKVPDAAKEAFPLVHWKVAQKDALPFDYCFEPVVVNLLKTLDEDASHVFVVVASNQDFPSIEPPNNTSSFVDFVNNKAGLVPVLEASVFITMKPHLLLLHRFAS